MEELFDFSEALRRLKAGEKVTRKIWGGYWFIPAGSVTATIGYNPIHRCDLAFRPILANLKDDGGLVPAQPYQADLLADDWMVYNK